jgi:hypothetical protein
MRGDIRQNRSQYRSGEIDRPTLKRENRSERKEFRQEKRQEKRELRRENRRDRRD